MKYRCHINVEYCGSIKAIQYLYKYIYKGTDQAYMELKQYKEETDEIKLHKYGRILTANECHYRIAGFKQHSLAPPVKRLSFFLPEEKQILLPENEVPTEESVEKQITETEYFQFFERNVMERNINDKFE